MAIKKSRTYIDTNTTGLVTVVEHNLGGTPDVFLTELDSGKEKYVSLYDPRISEIKNLDSDNTQLTFSSLFQGYVEFLLVEVDSPSDHERLLDLEDRYLKLLALIEDKTSKSQWTQMNTIFSAQIDALQTQINDLSSRLSIAESDIEAL